MKALIIYDSAFGNTEQIAMAMQHALAENIEVSAIRPVDFKPEMLNGLDLLIAGSPTQKFKPLKGISDLLIALPRKSLAGVRIAAFDTRVDVKKVNNKALNLFVYLFGFAAKPLSRKLVSRGGKVGAPPEGFLVDGTKGPVSAGELERAKVWAKNLNGNG